MRILIVDDSRVMSSVLAAVFMRIPHCQVAGCVNSGQEALDFLKNDNNIDLISLDVLMPEMDGFTTLKSIQIHFLRRQLKTPPVIMVSAWSPEGVDTVAKSLAAGALDFIPKPQANTAIASPTDLRNALSERIEEILNAEQLADATASAQLNAAGFTQPDTEHTSQDCQAIAIGASTGGPHALHEILPEICTKTSLPICIAQHMPKGFTASLADNLNKQCSAVVKEAEDHELLQPGTIYIAPSDYHLTLKRHAGQVYTRLSQDHPEKAFRPSVDILFSSFAQTYGSACLAVILTGMGDDGCLGIKQLFKAGAHILAQNKETSVVWGMPGRAYETGCVNELVALENIPETLVRSISQYGVRKSS